MQPLNRCANVNATFTIIKLTLYKENLHFPFVVILHVSITIIRNSPFFLYGSNYIGKFLCLKYSHSTWHFKYRFMIHVVLLFSIKMLIIRTYFNATLVYNQYNGGNTEVSYCFQIATQDGSNQYMNIFLRVIKCLLRLRMGKVFLFMYANFNYFFLLNNCHLLLRIKATRGAIK